MIRLVRILGVILMAAGVIAILTWLIEPIRDLWPLLFDAFRDLPIAIQIGLILAAVGFLLLLGSLIWERIEDCKSEKDLQDEG